MVKTDNQNNEQFAVLSSGTGHQKQTVKCLNKMPIAKVP